MTYLCAKKAKQWLDEHYPGNGIPERALRRLIATGQIPSVPATANKRLVDAEKLPEYLHSLQGGG